VDIAQVARIFKNLDNFRYLEATRFCEELHGRL
jgi:hypothetical protein